MEELYEELPGDQEEELYEDLPDSAYSGQEYPTPSPYPPNYQTHVNGAPPPLPTSSIPQYRPGAPPPSTSAPPVSVVPPLPTRSPSTQLSSGSARTLPPQIKKGKDAKKKGPPPSRAASGIDMKEILQRAKARPRNFDDLEKKKDDNPEEKYIVPWANQLRKTPQHRAVEEVEEQERELPEFVRKARTLSIADSLPDEEGTDSQSAPPTARKPPAPAPAPKYRVPSPPCMAPDAAGGGVADAKPTWQKQRDRQIALAMHSTEPATKPKPASKPPLPSKASPVLPSKASPVLPSKASPVLPSKESLSEVGREDKGKPHVTPRPKPKPSPRHQPPTGELAAVNVVTNGVSGSDSPTPVILSSIRDQVHNLEMNVGAESPPPTATPSSKPPLPKPMPRMPSNQNIPPLPGKPTPPLPISGGRPAPSKPAPPPPTSVAPPTSGAPPTVTRHPLSKRSSSPPISKGKPAPSQPTSEGKPTPSPPLSGKQRISPKPARMAPPIPTRGGSQISDSPPKPPPPETPPPPSSPPPSILSPPPPGQWKTSAPSYAPPPMQGPSVGQPTPPTPLVMQFRRLPLKSVGNPPSIPDRAVKPTRSPQLNGVVARPEVIPEIEPDEEDIYDDALPPSSMPEIPMEEEEELYDDVAVIQPTSQLPAAPTEAPPSIPSPNGTNGNGIADGPEDLYDDVSVFQHSTPSSHLPSSTSSNSLGPALPLPNPSLSSLVPPSPQKGGSTSPYTMSPTMARKQKLSKDEKKRLKEQEKHEKESKKKNDIRLKNRLKGIKAHKQFGLPNDVKNLFTVEVVLEHSRTKDHLACETGEVLFVLLIAHEKMPQDRYLVEKEEDGTVGFVKKKNTQRINYQTVTQSPSNSALSQAPPPIPDAAGYPDEDIYESLLQDELDPMAPPPWPSQPIPSLPPMNSAPRFPAPMEAPPPPPDDPEENYEYLPDEQ